MVIITYLRQAGYFIGNHPPWGAFKHHFCEVLKSLQGIHAVATELEQEWV